MIIANLKTKNVQSPLRKLGQALSTLTCAALVFAIGQTTAPSPALAASSKKVVRVGVSFATLREERWSREKKNLQKYAKEKGIDLIFQSANTDEILQNQQIENLITQKVDALIVVPQNRKSVIPAVESAEREGIPVIAYDRFIPSKSISLYLSFDAVKVGEAQARELIKRVPKGRYLWLGGDPADDNAHMARKGHMNILKPYIDRGDITIVSEQWCKSWSPQEALKYTEDALTAQKNKIDAVLASNDGTAGGAIQALTSQSLQGKVAVSGQDAELPAVQRIAQGTQTVTIYKDIRKLAKEAVDMAVALAQKAKIEKTLTQLKGIPSYLLEVTAVTQANLDSAVIESGFHKKRDVYRYVRRQVQ